MADLEKLKTDGLGTHGDDFYQLLMEVHDGLSTEESNALNARIVLLMANQIGDIETLEAILDQAKL